MLLTFFFILIQNVVVSINTNMSNEQKKNPQLLILVSCAVDRTYSRPWLVRIRILSLYPYTIFRRLLRILFFKVV